MRHNGFVAFILTHGRPDRVLTYEKLRKHGYTGKIYIVCDDEDKTLPEYRKRFGDVLVFSKSEIAKTFDEGDNFGDRRAIIYARNACFELAQQIGATHFIELDDDYTYFKFRFDDQLRWHGADVQDLDAVFDMLLDYFNSAPMLTLAIGQGGDYIGGEKATRFNDGIQPMRKAMNSFICSVDRPFQFVGRINEDVNTYVLLGSRGGVFLSILQIGLDQLETQSNSGGMTELYLDAGTYVKSFYTVMYCPSCVVVSEPPIGGCIITSNGGTPCRRYCANRLKSNDQWHHTQATTNRRKTAGMPVCRSCRICASNGGCRFVRSPQRSNGS